MRMTRQIIKLSSYRVKGVTFAVEFDYDKPGDRRAKIGQALKSIIGIHELNYLSNQAIKIMGSRKVAVSSNACRADQRRRRFQE